MVYLQQLIKKYFFIYILKYTLFLVAVIGIIDILNWPSKLIASLSAEFFWFIFVAVLLFVILVSFEFHVWDMLSINNLSAFDCAISVMCFTIIAYTAIAMITGILSCYKMIVIFIAFIVDIVCLIYRIKLYCLSVKNSGKYKSNVLDLKEIYNNTFTKESEVMLVEEKDVNYDLLERRSIINQLYNAIYECNPDGRFVISLEGKWGSGKTTIINNVKNKLLEYDNKMIIIDEFDPWTYNSQESMFYNMFDIILRKSGYKINTTSIRQMVNGVSDTIFGTYNKAGMLKSILKKPSELENIKTQINEYLRLCGKKIVFFIDNIDRADSNNIILLFKLIGNVFDFERVTYVLAFDNDRVKNAFDNDLNMDYIFLKKIIQMQIRVPEINRDIMQLVISKCLYNLLLTYGETKESFNDYQSIIDSIARETKDIRDFKRFINSVISTVFGKNTYLFKKDLLVMEYIRLNNFELYENIYHNRKYYISHDKRVDELIYATSFNIKQFNQNAKEYYSQIFETSANKVYLDMLGFIFPYVNKYISNQDLVYEGYYSYDNKEYSDIAKNKRISSCKYFDLYFSYSENDYLIISKIVDSLVSELNNAHNFVEKESIFINMLKSIPPSYNREVFEKFQFYIQDINKETTYDVLRILFNNVNKIDNSSAFFQLNALRRVEVIIWEILQIIPEEEFDDFLNEISESYEKIEIIDSIRYWYEHDNGGKSVEERKIKWISMEHKMSITIIENKINLYNNMYYSVKNIWGLIRINKDNIDGIKEYIKEIVDSKNVFRFLYDLMGVSYGSGYKYSISDENINLISSIEEIDLIIKNVRPQTEDEQFVMDVYNNYRVGKKDYWGDMGITKETEIKLNL